MSTTPIYAGTPKYGVANIITANTNLDGTGTIGTIFTAGASGSRIERINIKAAATTTAGAVRLFVHDGSTARLLFEQSVDALTPSATVKSFAASLDIGSHPQIMPLVLPTGYSLRASTHNAESFNVHANGGDF